MIIEIKRAATVFILPDGTLKPIKASDYALITDDIVDSALLAAGEKFVDMYLDKLEVVINDIKNKKQWKEIPVKSEVRLLTTYRKVNLSMNLDKLSHDLSTTQAPYIGFHDQKINMNLFLEVGAYLVRNYNTWKKDKVGISPMTKILQVSKENVGTTIQEKLTLFADNYHKIMTIFDIFNIVDSPAIEHLVRSTKENQHGENTDSDHLFKQVTGKIFLTTSPTPGSHPVIYRNKVMLRNRGVNRKQRELKLGAKILRLLEIKENSHCYCWFDRKQNVIKIAFEKPVKIPNKELINTRIDKQSRIFFPKEFISKTGFRCGKKVTVNVTQGKPITINQYKK
ncbi:MAG: hypothetical protein ACXAEU_16075 [Candidatus Hodarchaeales archaeon]